MGFGHMIVDLTQGVLPIIAPLLSLKLGLSFFQIGTVALAFTFSSAIIQPAFGILSDRYNMAWLMPTGLFLSGLGLALTGIVNSYTVLLLAVLISGMGVAGYHPEASKLTHRVSDNAKRGSSMAIFSVGGNIGFGIGPMLAIFLLGFNGLGSIHNVIIPGLLTSLVFLYMLPRFNKILKVHNPPKTIENAVSENTDVADISHGSSEDIVTKSPSKKLHLLLLILYVTVRSWIHSGLIYFIPFYFPEFKGIDEPQYLISIFLLAGILGTIIGGPFADKFGGRTGLLVSMVISLFTVFPFVHFGGVQAPILAFIVGAALISTFSTTVVFGQRLIPNNVGLASGLVLGFGVGMGSTGVTLLGVVADYTGLPFIINIIAGLPVLGILIALALPNDK
jgi:FSR family fosmidomycin resistance protein-like MFS transporter